MHKACAYTLPVPNAIGNGHLPEDSIGGRGGWGIKSRGWVGEGGVGVGGAKHIEERRVRRSFGFPVI